MPQAVPAIIVAAGQVAAEVAVAQILAGFVASVALRLHVAMKGAPFYWRRQR